MSEGSIRRLVCVGSFLVALVLGLTILMFFFFETSSPKLVFDMYSTDLGELSEGETPEVTFTFHNRGDAELVIYELEASCNCQNLRFSRSRIAPGGSGDLHATVLPKYFGGPALDIIRVSSNDKKDPVQVLRIKRFIVKRIVVQPDRLILSQRSDTHHSARKVIIFGPTARTQFKPIKVDSDDEPAAADFTYLGLTEDKRAKWEVRIDVNTQTLHKSRETKQITIHTSDPNQPTISIPVLIEKKSPLRASPNFLSLITGGARPLEKTTVHVTYFTSAAHVHPPVVLAPEHVSVSLLSSKSCNSSKTWIFEVGIDASSDPKAKMPTSEIKFDFQVSDLSIAVPISVIRLDKTAVAIPQEYLPNDPNARHSLLR